jgi:protein TonB
MAAQTAERRPLGALGRMSVVAAIHVAAFVVIVRGLSMVPSLTIKPMEGVRIDEPQPVIPEPPPIDDSHLRLEHQIDLPQPDPPPIPVDPPENAVSANLRPIEEIGPETGSAVVVPEVVGARLDPRRPLSQPIYPAPLIRENAQGFVDVEVFVQPDGRVGDARIVKTSGYEAFDRNTLDEAKHRWRLVPATRDGVAIPQWYRLRVVFKLKNP